MIGGNGGIGGNGSAGADGKDESGALYGQTVQEKNNASENWTVIASGNTSEKRYVKIESDGYPLWVSGVQVTSANATDVLANDPDNAGKVSFTPADGETKSSINTLQYTTEMQIMI